VQHYKAKLEVAEGEIVAAKRTNQQLGSEVQELESSLRSTKSVHRQATTEKENLKRDLQQFKSTASQLSNRNVELGEIVHQQSQDVLRMNQEHLEEKARSAEEREKLQQEINDTETENLRLRATISKMQIVLTPVHDEAHYIQRFEGLKTKLQNWVVAQVKACSSRAMSADSQNQLHGVFQTLGKRGATAAGFLNPKEACEYWYRDAKMRIQFIRHIVALFLFVKVFDAFLPGLSPEASAVLQGMERDIISQGFLRIHTE